MKKLLIIGAGILQVAVINKAKEMGIYTVVVDGNPDALGLAIADKPIVVNILNQEAVLIIAKEENVNGVIHPCSEVAMHTMGFINDTMGLSGIGLETAVKATNKEKMRQAFKAFKAPSPISKGAFSNIDALLIAKEIKGDIIVKPSRSSGSRGVTRLPENADESEIIAAFDRAIGNSYDRSIVIEEYIEGPEFSVEIVIWNKEPRVLAVTDKLTSGAPYFVELGHSQPSQYSKQELITIENAAIAGCNTLCLNWCVAHAEIKLQNGKPYLIEIGARLGGDFISTELVHLSTGIDMVAAAINLALGEIPDLTPKHDPQGAAIRYFTPTVGKLTKLDITNVTKENPQAYQFEIYKKIGDMIPEVKSSLDRSGHIITVGKDAQDAIINAEMILNRIEYVTEE
jgi:biotin carboxylase